MESKGQCGLLDMVFSPFAAVTLRERDHTVLVGMESPGYGTISIRLPHSDLDLVQVSPRDTDVL